jgi:hypothetical protein
LAEIAADCTVFQDRCANALANLPDGYDLGAAGRDFWFTRNGYGVGFLSRDVTLPDVLDATARTFRNVDLYAGDDGRLYLS